MLNVDLVTYFNQKCITAPIDLYQVPQARLSDTRTSIYRTSFLQQQEIKILKKIYAKAVK